ncbi:hypothetical protein JCM16303_003873 [Sporobolomyces ruberrimus]
MAKVPSIETCVARSSRSRSSKARKLTHRPVALLTSSDRFKHFYAARKLDRKDFTPSEPVSASQIERIDRLPNGSRAKVDIGQLFKVGGTRDKANVEARDRLRISSAKLRLERLEAEKARLQAKAVSSTDEVNFDRAELIVVSQENAIESTTLASGDTVNDNDLHAVVKLEPTGSTEGHPVAAVSYDLLSTVKKEEPATKKRRLSREANERKEEANPSQAAPVQVLRTPRARKPSISPTPSLDSLSSSSLSPRLSCSPVFDSKPLDLLDLMHLATMEVDEQPLEPKAKPKKRRSIELKAHPSTTKNRTKPAKLVAIKKENYEELKPKISKIETGLESKPAKPGNPTASMTTTATLGQSLFREEPSPPLDLAKPKTESIKPEEPTISWESPFKLPTSSSSPPVVSEPIPVVVRPIISRVSPRLPAENEWPWFKMPKCRCGNFS